jgi:hypothetical protein
MHAIVVDRWAAPGDCNSGYSIGLCLFRQRQGTPLLGMGAYPPLNDIPILAELADSALERLAQNCRWRTGTVRLGKFP